jgi:hypothetical protein
MNGFEVRAWLAALLRWWLDGTRWEGEVEDLLNIMFLRCLPCLLRLLCAAVLSFP